MDLFSIDNLQSSNNLTYQELSEKMLKKVKVKKLERRKKLWKKLLQTNTI